MILEPSEKEIAILTMAVLIQRFCIELGFPKNDDTAVALRLVARASENGLKTMSPAEWHQEMQFLMTEQVK